MWRGERRIRVLVVDDEQAFREALARRLEKRGAVVAMAADGEEALASLKKESVDVVLLDVNMPGLNGLATLERIRAGHPHTEAILITGQASTKDGVAGIKAGAFDYLSKPIEIEHLVEKIRQAFDKLRRQEEEEKEVRFRARMEQQLAATERLASLGTLSAGVAHEINNPLAIIDQASGYLRGKAAKDETLSKEMASSIELALNKIDKSVVRAKRITHQLLSFCRRNDSAVQEFDLLNLVREVAELTQKVAQEHQAELIVEPPEGEFMIWSDPYQLRQVLVNIVTNGLQAVDLGGRVRVELSEKDNWVLVVIRDNGPGIPPENMAKIFEPFFTTKPPGQGTGLGLSVSRGIIEKLGGGIEIESKLGAGAVFKLVIPKMPPTAQQSVSGAGI